MLLMIIFLNENFDKIRGTDFYDDKILWRQNKLYKLYNRADLVPKE